jgi:hypothetical protein
VARLYRDLLDLFIVDRSDATLLRAIEALPVKAATAETVMRNLEAKISLAKETVSSLALLRPQ